MKSRSAHSDAAWAILSKTLPLIEIKQGKGAYSLDIYCSVVQSTVHGSFLVQDPSRKETNLNMELFRKNYGLQVLTMWRTMMCFRKVVILVLYNAGCNNVMKLFLFQLSSIKFNKKKKLF
jgi:hypothetical protein